MNMEFAHIRENIEAMTAEQALRAALRESMEMNGDPFTITRGSEIQPHRHTDPKAPKGLCCIAQDGERNGRLAWVPGV
jgi:hypothetical protein